MACKGSGVHRAWPPRRSTEGAIVRLTSSATRSRRFHSEPCCLQWHVNPAERQPYGRYRFARYGAIDEIVRAEVGRRWVPGAVSSPRSIRLRLPEGGARPMLQAAKRAGVAAQSRPDRPAAIEFTGSAGPTGHGGLEPRRMVTASLPQPVFGMSESLVTALTIVTPFVRARLPGLAEPEAVRGQRHGRRQSRRNAAAIHGPPRFLAVAGSRRWVADGVPWVATSVTTSAAISASTS
jgi:hypothetical protein